MMIRYVIQQESTGGFYADNQQSTNGTFGPLIEARLYRKQGAAKNHAKDARWRYKSGVDKTGLLKVIKVKVSYEVVEE